MAAYDELVTFVASQGISEDEAQLAIKRCTMAMMKYGAATYTGAGLLAYFMNANPASAAGFAVTAFGSGATIGLIKSPQCSEIRSAIRQWSTNPI